jgi:hypothetical protein
MHQVNVHLRVYDGAKDVVRRVHVIVHRVTFVRGGLHAVRGCALFREVDDGVGTLVLEEVHEALVVLRDV